MSSRFLIISTLFVLLSLIVDGQNCAKFNRTSECKVKNSDNYKRFGQSKNAVVDAGKTFKFQVVLFGGYDYKIGLCTEKGYKPIHIKIVNADDQSVIYDNVDDDYTETVGFSNETTKNVILEITCMASEMEFRDIGDSRTCLGIAIFWRKIPKMGEDEEQ